MARPTRLTMVVAAGVVGAYIGFWIANLAGWSGNARWPLDLRGGVGTLLVVIAVAATASLVTGVMLHVPQPSRTGEWQLRASRQPQRCRSLENRSGHA